VMGGDVHYSEISGIDKKFLGYKSFEFVSSSMHSSTQSSYHQNPNPQLQGTLKENFLLFEKQGGAQDPSWKVSSIGADKKILFDGLYNL
jgi:alkaline phosphatase D